MLALANNNLDIQLYTQHTCPIAKSTQFHAHYSITLIAPDSCGSFYISHSSSGSIRLPIATLGFPYTRGGGGGGGYEDTSQCDSLILFIFLLLALSLFSHSRIYYLPVRLYILFHPKNTCIQFKHTIFFFSIHRSEFHTFVIDIKKKLFLYNHFFFFSVSLAFFSFA